MQLVDFRDQFPEKIPSGTEYDPSLRYLLWLTLHLLQFKISIVVFIQALTIQGIQKWQCKPKRVSDYASVFAWLT
jgi:hypothetical protein